MQNTKKEIRDGKNEEDKLQWCRNVKCKGLLDVRKKYVWELKDKNINRKYRNKENLRQEKWKKGKVGKKQKKNTK